ncbi:MAG: HAD family hydrolase [Spirochaetales bacterium]|jgi:putative hydrolase of the HAD superfamily|nr:HAD family hydrolase [Spirochaetales bacterium]
MQGGDYFTGLIRRYSPPAHPLPAGACFPRADSAAPARGIRAYLFDVYGTLFTSDSGDIGTLTSSGGGEASPRGAAENTRVQELLAPFGKDCALPELVRRFTAAVTAEHARLRLRYAARDVYYPEIDVRKIWAGILHISEEAAADFALRFELAINPVYPMPGLADTLYKLRAAGFPLGIVSNAQFFTPFLFEAFLGETPGALGFLPDLCLYSFREGEAKPSPRLFRRAAGALAALGIRPEETVYAGNDMLNDVWAAKEAGFCTALFAGDGRSLRLRGDDPRCAGLKPDFVLKSLASLPGIS